MRQWKPLPIPLLKATPLYGLPPSPIFQNNLEPPFYDFQPLSPFLSLTGWPQYECWFKSWMTERRTQAQNFLFLFLWPNFYEDNINGSIYTAGCPNYGHIGVISLHFRFFYCTLKVRPDSCFLSPRIPLPLLHYPRPP